MTVTEAIRELRNLSGLNQQFFATTLRMSTRALSMYESGKTPEPKQLVAFAAFADRLNRPDIVELLIRELERQLQPPPGYVSAVVFRRRQLVPAGPGANLDATEDDLQRIDGVHGRKKR